MRVRVLLLMVLILAPTSAPRADGPRPWWADDVDRALAKAKENRPQLEKALADVPEAQRKGMAFLVANMPDKDLASLRADFLLENVALAYKAREEVPWGKVVPEEVFLNDVLPYANVDERRDAWRKEFYDLCMPIAKTCKNPTEAVNKLNVEVFKALNVKYSTERKAANQSPKESIEQGKASCTGLSIVLSDACRAVCIPARLAGTPNWKDKRGNHTWVEVWDNGWHFTGACEPDPNGLDRGWFVGDAAQAVEDSPEHAIYAASFRRTGLYFPLVWARRDETVAAENVTSRYAKKPDAAELKTVRLMIRVVNQRGKRVVADVRLTAAGEAKPPFEGKSRGESADTNDILAFRVAPDAAFEVRVGDAVKAIRTGEAGGHQMVDVEIDDPPSSDDHISNAAIESLRKGLASKPSGLADLAEKDFAKVPLTKADARAARELLWMAHAEKVREERAEEVKARVLKDGDLEMPFAFTTFGDKPEEGRSLWISLHGGGNTAKAANDRQWENQKKLYKVEEGIYLAPRAPTNTWNLWHEAHIDRLFDRLIEDLIVLEGVDPGRVYVLGYSAGGDGVYQIAPRMADRWAGAAMMAGHPNGVSMLSMRNVPFALQVGANDKSYNRNTVAKEYGQALDKLREADPKGYEHFVRVREGKGHWMDLEDKEALPWLAKFRRDPIPERVVWKQTGPPRDRSYWLAVPKGEAKGDSLVAARREGQTIEIVAAEKVPTLLVRLDDRMADLDRPVKITRAGKVLHEGIAPRTIAGLIASLSDRGDPELMFDAEVRVELSDAAGAR